MTVGAANGVANGTAANGVVNGHAKAGTAPTGSLLQVVSTENYSELQHGRIDYVPPQPDVLKGAFKAVNGAVARPADARVTEAFPKLAGIPHVSLQSSGGPLAAAPGADRALNIGVVLSGGQAPGGHNVIAGIFDLLARRRPGSRLFGFLNGPRGIVQGDAREITSAALAPFRNQGGFNIIGSGRDKIESAEQLAAAATTARNMELDGLVVIGGDDSNTNAAVLAEYFLAKGLKTSVVGVPKTIDGDLKNDDVPISFGFDTACKVYSEMIGNIMIDAASARKYYHFVRLMGRSASHIALEAALQTHPQAALISEEVAAHGSSLADITKQLADMVAARADAGKNYGVVLVPEGLIECVPEVGVLIGELNELLAGGGDGSAAAVAPRLSPASRAVFEMFPAALQAELLEERDPHGNVQVARIQTEGLLLQLVAAELDARKGAGAYAGKFAGLAHYMGYEGRCSLPTNFDATYTCALGHAAGALVEAGATGLMATIGNLAAPAAQWTVGGTPLTGMMCIERRKGKDKPVVRKALVDLEGPVFREFVKKRAAWALQDAYRSPGPIQFAGTPSAHLANLTLALEINGGKPISIH